jgi:hypothetical protein
VDADIHEVSQGGDDLHDLLGQLSGGSQHEGLAVLDVDVQLLQDADREGGGLSGTCEDGDERDAVLGALVTEGIVGEKYTGLMGD